MAGARSGFWQEYTAAVVLAILLGAAGAAGVAGVLDAALGQMLGDVLGAPNEQTLIVHVRAEAADAAAAHIGTLLESLEAEAEGAAPGSLAVRRGVTVAGNANFFVTIPEELVESDFLERMPEVLQQLPGFNGSTWLLEPGVTVAAAEGAVRDVLAEEAEALAGVRAVVRHGTRFTAIVRDEGARKAVAEELERRLKGRRVVDLRWPDQTPASTAGRLRSLLEARFERMGWHVLDTAGDVEAAGPFGSALAALEALPDAWSRWTGAGADAEAALRQLIAAVDALEPLIAGPQQPEEQARRLSEALRAGDGAGAVKDVLLRLAASALWQALTGEGESKAAAQEAVAAADPSADLPERWEQLRELLVEAADGAARASEMSQEDLTTISEAVAAVGRLLPGARREGGGLTILADGAASAPAVEDFVRRELEERAVGGDLSTTDLSGLRAFVGAPGAVEPNPRAVLADLLGDVRRAVAGMLALLAASAALFLDQAAVFAAWPRLPSAARRARPRAAAVGALLFAATYWLAGGGLPGGALGGPGPAGYLEIVFIALLGAGAGALALKLAPRIGPVDEAELLAGLSLGLDDGQILREIVVPRGRPGVLTFLNEFRREF